MNRASLVAPLALLLSAVPLVARAADPPATGSAADPFASPPEEKQPSTDDQEAAVLGPPARPNPNSETPPPGPPAPTAPPRRPVATARTRKASQANDEDRATPGERGSDPSGFALELSTAGFASGSLVGGLFLGGRTASGLILGGFLNYGLTSIDATTPTGPTITNSAQIVRIGAGLRHSFVRSADRLVDLFGAADASFDYRGAEVTSVQGVMPTQTVSASGFSLAAGPGLRLWVHEQIAIGYVALLRITYLTGQLGALPATPTEDTTDASKTQVGFDGTFQVLGVF